MKQKIVGAQIKIAFDWRCRSWGPLLLWINWTRRG